MSDDDFKGAATNNADIIYQTAAITAAYVTKNTISATDFPGLITRVHAALAGLGGASATPVAEAEIEKATPAQIRKSITPDAIVSFIDGKAYKTLKRHLGANGLDPHSYRHRYGLPNDYPMVAPNYAARRSELAKSLGVGRTGGRA
ncbi:MucR family transcriptional regulator [Methylorubrum extorquens]|uniref:Transcriptional regulator, MucR family n=1 Tax=Methylorubrum extorquens (strain CM4 / NCIMB 13688) TaxID=440085 RepID=B7KSX2_METC4|nr:MucR family transcriptional regulator [Methylorubrum extorquens]ACK82474.1 transcriptional regulator, MucR family [Methylorubrum extorquens CM4]